MDPENPVEFKTEEEEKEEESKEAMAFYESARKLAHRRGYGWLSEDFASQALLWRYVELKSGSLDQLFAWYYQNHVGSLKASPGKLEILRATSYEGLTQAGRPQTRFEEPLRTISPIFLSFVGTERAILVLYLKWDFEIHEIAEAFGWGLKKTEKIVKELIDQAYERALEGE